jgi:hypothetical protein
MFWANAAGATVPSRVIAAIKAAGLAVIIVVYKEKLSVIWDSQHYSPPTDLNDITITNQNGRSESSYMGTSTGRYGARQAVEWVDPSLFNLEM